MLWFLVQPVAIFTKQHVHDFHPLGPSLRSHCPKASIFVKQWEFRCSNPERCHRWSGRCSSILPQWSNGGDGEKLLGTEKKLLGTIDDLQGKIDDLQVSLSGKTNRCVSMTTIKFRTMAVTRIHKCVRVYKMNLQLDAVRSCLSNRTLARALQER